MLKNVLERQVDKKGNFCMEHDIHLICNLYKNKEDLTGVTSFNQQINT